MNCRRRISLVVCGAALLLTFSVVDAAVRAPRPKAEPPADAAQRRRARRHVKRRAATVRKQEGRVAEGMWGGLHLRLSVGREGAFLEFDCARGQIVAPFETDAEGGFDLPGTYTRQGHGPIRIGREPTAQPARYSGRVEGARMTLSVKLDGTDKPLAEYTLTHGEAGRVMKCR